MPQGVTVLVPLHLENSLRASACLREHLVVVGKLLSSALGRSRRGGKGNAEKWFNGSCYLHHPRCGPYICLHEVESSQAFPEKLDCARQLHVGMVKTVLVNPAWFLLPASEDAVQGAPAAKHF